MDHLQGYSTYNENHDVTPHLKFNIPQSEKKLFGERKNLDKCINFPKLELKETPRLKIASPKRTPAAKGEHAKAEKKQQQPKQKTYNGHFDLEFARPCCSKKNTKPLNQIWADMNMIDDAKLDELLKISHFDLDDDQIEVPKFSLTDEIDEDFLRMNTAQKADTEEEIILPKIKLPKYDFDDDEKPINNYAAKAFVDNEEIDFPKLENFKIF